MAGNSELSKLFLPSDYAAFTSPKEENLADTVAANYTDSKGQPLDESGITLVSAALLKHNPHIGQAISPDTIVTLPLIVGSVYFLKKKPGPDPELPKQPPHPPKQVPPPDPKLPTDPPWDWKRRDVTWTGSTIDENDGCKGHFEHVVEKDGTQEQRTRAGSFVFIRYKKTEGKDIL
jgi:hypothetical protein